MKFKIAILVFWAVWAAGGAPAAQTATTTQTLDVPAGGTLRFKKSIGEMTVEGWDQPRVEIVAVKSVKAGYDEKDESKWLERVRVHAERHGNDIAVDTVYPKRLPLARPFRDGGMSPIELERRVKAPRNARLAIERQSGEVHLEFMTGDVRVTDGRGQITLYLPEGQYSSMRAASSAPWIPISPAASAGGWNGAIPSWHRRQPRGAECICASGSETLPY